MDLHTLAAGYSPRRALALEHAELPPNAVLCAKLLALFWLGTGQVVHVRSTFVPFVFDLALDLPPGSLLVPCVVLAQLLAILTVVCSRFVRTGCAMLASIIMALALADQPLFSNNRAFCALVLAMLAFGDRGRLARLQVALVYACAALDKLLSADWRSGWFLETFGRELCRVGELWSPGWLQGAPLPLTCALSDQLAARPSFATLSSWLVILTELVLALGYLRGARSIALLAVAFHCLIFLATGSTFGVFFYAGLACSVLVLDLPRLPAPFGRALPYLLAGACLAGPWVRPWHAAVFAGLVLALSLRRGRTERPGVPHER